VIDRMRTYCTVAVTALALSIGLALAASSSPGAPGTSTITVEKARFEFLTPTLVRMEYSPSGAFIDAPTAVVQKRDWPAVQVERREENGWLVAVSSAMTLRYRLRSGAFDVANLRVTWKDQAGAAHEWHPGQTDPLNLGGLTYSLDNVSAANLPKDGMDLESPLNDEIPGIDLVLGPAQPGLLSRSGFAFIDDSPTPVLNAQRSWIASRGRSRTDRIGTCSPTDTITPTCWRSTPNSPGPFP